MRLSITAVLFVILSGCGISADNVRPDGTVVIEVASESTYRIDGDLYFQSSMWEAMVRARNVQGLKQIEFRIPQRLLGKDEAVSCGRFVSVVTASPVRISWRAYAWNPSDEHSLHELKCEIVVVS